MKVVAKVIIYCLVLLAGVVPVLYLLFSGLKTGNTGVSWLNEFFIKVLWFTYFQAFISSIISALVGLLVAVYLLEKKSWASSVFESMYLVAFSLPTILVCFILVSFWGVGGLGLSSVFYGWFGILVAHIFLNAPLFVRWFIQSLKEQSQDEEKIALSLGASRLICFSSVTLRKLTSPFYKGFAFSFLYCSHSLLVLLLLGGGPRFTSLEVALYQAIKIELDMPLAMKLASVQFFFSFLIFILIMKTKKKEFQGKESEWLPIYLDYSRVFGLSVKILFWMVSLILIMGPLAYFLFSLRGVSYSLISSLPILSSLKLSVTVSILTVLFALLSTLIIRMSIQKNNIEFLASFSILFSPLFLSFSVFYFYNNILPQGISNFWGPVMIQTFLFLPLAFHLLQTAWERIPSLYDLQAQSLGASHRLLLVKIQLPLLKRSLLSCLSFILALSLGEVSSLLLFSNRTDSTLSLEFFERMSKYRFQEAEVIGAVMLLLIVILQWGFLKWQK